MSHRRPAHGARSATVKGGYMENLSKDTMQVIMSLEAALSDMFEAIDEVQTAKMVLMQEREHSDVKTVAH